jgi:hypothetical protein
VPIPDRPAEPGQPAGEGADPGGDGPDLFDELRVARDRLVVAAAEAREKLAANPRWAGPVPYAAAAMHADLRLPGAISSRGTLPEWELEWIDSMVPVFAFASSDLPRRLSQRPRDEWAEDELSRIQDHLTRLIRMARAVNSYEPKPTRARLKRWVRRQSAEKRP